MTKQKQTDENVIFKLHGELAQRVTFLEERLTDGEYKFLTRKKPMWIKIIYIAAALIVIGLIAQNVLGQCGHYEQGECIAWSEPQCADTETYCTRWCCNTCCNWATECVEWYEPTCTDYDQIWIEDECGYEPEPPSDAPESPVTSFKGGGGCLTCLLPKINSVDVNKCEISIFTSQFMKSKVVCDDESHQFPLILGKPLINANNLYTKVLLSDGDGFWTYFTFTFPDFLGSDFYCRAISETPAGVEAWSEEFQVTDCQSTFGLGGSSSPPPPEPQIDWTIPQPIK